MIRICAVLLCTLLLMTLASTPHAQESSFPDIQQILDARKIRVAILAQNAPPMILTDDKGLPIGSEVDLALDLGRKLGVAVEFLRSADTYDGVVDQVARGEADIAVSFLSRGVERAKKVLFSVPYVRQTRPVLYNRAILARLKRDYEIDVVSDLADTEAAKAMEIAVLEGSIYATLVERDLPQLPIRHFDSVAEVVQAVKDGLTFGGLHGGIAIDYYMREHPETAIYVGIEPDLQRPDDISIAVRPDAPNLLRWINIYLDNHVGLMDSEEVIDRFLNQQGSRR